jgi:hypothetical protein
MCCLPHVLQAHDDDLSWEAGSEAAEHVTASEPSRARRRGPELQNTQ